MKKVYIFLFILLAILRCKAPTPQGDYDYILSQDSDIIFPPSGTAQQWVTIIGGNHTGKYYVAPDGSDTNPGTAAAPFKTLGYAVAQLQPGDTLVVFARDRSRTPVIAGENNLFAAFDISNCQYLRIENLEITSNNGRPFREAFTGTSGPVAHIILQDIKVHHIDEFGVDISDANDLQIINCQFTYCGFGCIGGPAGQQGGLRNVLIKDCDLSYSGHYYQGGDGSNRPYDRPDGFGIEASEGPIEIVNTTATHNYGDGLDSKAKRTFIHECLVASNSCDGVKLWGDSSRVVNTLIYGRGDGDNTATPWSPLVIHTESAHAYFEIVNCTIDDSLGENYLMHIQYDHPAVPVFLRIVNTIFASRGANAPALWLAPAVNYEIHHNLFYTPQDDRLLIQGDTTYTAAEVGQVGPGNIYGNPLFVRTGWEHAGDYHLNIGSPAIDAGDASVAPGIDREYQPRPQGGGVDIGCYER